MKTWAMNYDNCQACGTINKQHKGDGLCTTCYYRQYQRKKPAQRTDALERFANELPILLRKMGISTLTTNYNNGTVTIKKMGTKMSITWPES